MSGDLTQRLWQARLDGSTVAVTDSDRPADDAAAYAMQAELTDLAGAEVVGFKIGATADASVQLLGVDGPFFGPLFRQYTRDSGEPVKIDASHSPGIESEFVIGLSADLPPRPDAAYTEAEVRAAIAWVAPGFEIVGTRMAGGLPGAGAMVVVDSGVNLDFVLGERCVEWESLDLGAHGAVLTINGEQVAEGHSGMSSFGGPIGAVVWLANHAGLGERGLRQGDMVTTGTCTGVVPVSVGDSASADFGTLGRVETSFLAAR